MRRFPQLLVLLAVALIAACPKGGGSSRVINGRVIVLRGAETVPVGDAQVRIWPTEPGAKSEAFDFEPVQNLRGVTSTRASGAWEITSLSSPQTQAEYPLLKGWTYAVEVEVPGYYITTTKFDYGGGAPYVEIEIQEKTADVLDTTGGVQENEKRLERGSVRKE